MFRIAIDARPLTQKHRTGVENVGAQFAKLLISEPRRHRWHFYFAEPPNFTLPNEIRWRSYQGPGWLRLVLPLWLLVDRIHLVHFYLSYVPPLIRFLKTRTVVTVCDLMWLDDISFVDTPSRKFFVKGILPSLKKRVDRFIAISEATKRDLVARLGVAPERVSVVHPYVDERFRPVEGAKEEIRRIYGIDGDFLLFVGTVKPNKNMGRILDAFGKLRKRHSSAILVVAGFAPPFWDDAKRVVKGEPGVRWLNYVPDEHLPLLYSSCLALVSPSINEGFGLPLLEAMACGAAVIAGNTGAQPEVVGDAGLLVDPFDTEAITQALFALWENPSLRRELGQKAIERALSFSPQRTLAQLLDAYEKDLSHL
ncbi:MAG: glycosyltransferase family 1 protein [Armatimonadota bacterium]|nr:glycosyltransferase family 4 protein [Armatimonadota bacterium]MDW8143823.1 glycosyltransferase family 1 protein [Armatimonadota bacterium]